MSRLTTVCLFFIFLIKSADFWNNTSQILFDENEVVPENWNSTNQVLIDENEVVPEKISHEDLTLANSTLGFLRGKTIKAVNGKDVDQYLGIPFAEPPLGVLRFQKPVPKKPWEGVYNAWNLPNSCMQLIDTYLGDFAGAAMWNANTPLSEDCLYLNIWVPRPRPTNAPVMVWIYGGGFFSGSNTLDIYNGSVLASEENVIVVSMQYRLGPFGFFYFGINEAAGNQGLHDQVLALQWIQGNIENFGGHPKYVTLFGESAGAACVGLHLMSPLSSGLFMQAILQSGAPTADWVSVSPQVALNRSVDFSNRLDCPSEPLAAVECLRKIDAQTLVDDIPATGNVFDYFFNPVVDGEFLPKSPADVLKFGGFKRTNLLLGSTTNEGTAFLVYIFPEIFQLHQEAEIKRSDYTEAVFKLFPNMSATATQALAFQYTDWVRPDDSSRLVDNLEKMIGDKCITCDMSELANAYAGVGSGVFMYEFAHRSSNSPWPKWMGAHHTHEIHYVFGKPLDIHLNFTEQETNLTRRVMNYWANFARTGNPSLSNTGEFSKRFWPVYTSNGKEYLHITADQESVKHGLRAQHCAFWKRYLPNLTKVLHEIESTAADAKSYCISSNPDNEEKLADPQPELLDVDDEWAMEFQDWKKDHAVWKKEFQKYVNTLENARKLTNRRDQDHEL